MFLLQFACLLIKGLFHKSWAQIIEIALSICTLCELLCDKKLLKSWALCFALCAQLYEINPRVEGGRGEHKVQKQSARAKAGRSV